MLDWSKSYELYLSMSDKQRLGIGVKSHEILYPEMNNLVEEELVRPSLYLMSLASFISLREDVKEKEYRFFKEVTGYKEKIERFEELVNKGKNEQIGEFLRVYFQKVGGDVLTAYLSLGLALLTIKGEITDEEKELIEKLHG